MFLQCFEFIKCYLSVEFNCVVGEHTSYQRPREQKLCKLVESSSVIDCLSIFLACLSTFREALTLCQTFGKGHCPLTCLLIDNWHVSEACFFSYI